jgi:hypothetical protein
LGNLFTLTPIKKSNLFINDNKVLSTDQLNAIRDFKVNVLNRIYIEQQNLFNLTSTKDEDIKNTVSIINFLIGKIGSFKANLTLRPKKTRSLSCVLTSYHDVFVKDDDFINDAYTTPDIALIESMEIVLDKILESHSIIMERFFYEKMRTYYTSRNEEFDFSQPLHILLDIIRLGVLFLENGITLIDSKKKLLSVATSISKALFTPAKYTSFIKENRLPGDNMAGGTKKQQFYQNKYDTQASLNETQMIKEMNSLGIYMNGATQSLIINSKATLMALQKNFVYDKIKHELYESEIETIDDISVINSLYEAKINDITISAIIHDEMYKNEIMIDRLLLQAQLRAPEDVQEIMEPIDLNDVFEKENKMISVLNTYQSKNANKQVVNNSSNSTTKKKKRSSDTIPDKTPPDDIAYENIFRPNTYDSPHSSPSNKKNKLD